MPDPRLTGIHRFDAEPQRNWTFRIDGSTITYDVTQVNGSAVAGRAVGGFSGLARLAAVEEYDSP